MTFSRFGVLGLEVAYLTTSPLTVRGEDVRGARYRGTGGKVFYLAKAPLDMADPGLVDPFRVGMPP